MRLKQKITDPMKLGWNRVFKAKSFKEAVKRFRDLNKIKKELKKHPTRHY
jgi:hypothetical protein